MNVRENEERKKKKPVKVQPKKKVWGTNVDRNKTVRAERHAKRMDRQAKRVAEMKVPHGTARARNMPQRVAARKENVKLYAFKQTYWQGMADQFKQSERERKANERAAEKASEG